MGLTFGRRDRDCRTTSNRIFAYDREDADEDMWDDESMITYDHWGLG